MLSNERTRIKSTFGLQSWKIDDFTNAENSLTAGFMFEFGSFIDGYASFETGLTYLQSEFEAKEKYRSDTDTNIYRFDYVSIPLGLRFYFDPSKENFFVRVGLMPGYLVSAEGSTSKAGPDKDIRNDYPKWVPIVYTGAGFHYQLTESFGASVEANYSRFVTNFPGDKNANIAGWSFVTAISKDI